MCEVQHADDGGAEAPGAKHAVRLEPQRKVAVIEGVVMFFVHSSPESLRGNYVICCLANLGKFTDIIREDIITEKNPYF